MKKGTTALLSLLGFSLLLTACGTPMVQQTTTPSVQNASAPSAPSPSAVSDGYVQVYIDPETGNLITIDPQTGETRPYEAPTTVSDSTASAATGTNSNAAPTSGSSTTVNQSSLQSQNTTTTASYIGENKAIEVAVQHAGVASSDVVFSLAKLEQDNGRYEYDVEFYAGNKEYDYSVDAVAGTVLNFDYDMESYFTPPVQTQTASSANSNTQTQTASSANSNTQTQTQAPAQTQTQAALAVSIDTARQTALSRVPGATANNIRIVTDYDDGRMVYDGKIIYNNLEYDFEIDAATGTVTEWDVDSIYD